MLVFGSETKFLVYYEDVIWETIAMSIDGCYTDSSNCYPCSRCGINLEIY